MSITLDEEIKMVEKAENAKFRDKSKYLNLGWSCWFVREDGSVFCEVLGKLTNKYEIGDCVFCRFRGKWNIGNVEFRGMTCGMNWYDIKIKGAKRLQRKYENDLKPTCKLDENGNIIVPKWE